MLPPAVVLLVEDWSSVWGCCLDGSSIDLPNQQVFDPSVEALVHANSLLFKFLKRPLRPL